MMRARWRCCSAGWGVDVVGITTTIDPGGRRAGCVRYCLQLVGRDDIPVVAGAEVSKTTGRPAEPRSGRRYWPASITPEPSSSEVAASLLRRSVEQGATLIGIGPYTNLALLEEAYPGSLALVPVVLMGGCVYPPAAGLPPWGPEKDWNVQWDTGAAAAVAAAATDLTLVTLPATLKAHLRAAHLPRLRASGALGELLARQSEAHAHDHGIIELARTHQGLPDDLLNFHYDPVTCAVAVGWPGAKVEEIALSYACQEGVFRWSPDSAGRATRVLLDLDGHSFNNAWLEAIEVAQRS
jgi:inosine-uridine nucleoside N-ribohydrolase